MENILVVGANTRSVVSSLKELNYNIYSVDYFGTRDLRANVNKYKSVLAQEAYESCGYFTENFNPDYIVELSKDFMDVADHIICLAGVNPENYPKKKLIGNKTVKDVEDKYKLYRTLKDEFNLPLTYNISDVNEAIEITDNYPSKKFILKPIKGSGGYGVRDCVKFDENDDLSGYILQESIEGLNISSSVLSTGDECRTVIMSKQIIGEANLGQRRPYGYCGNITPCLYDKDFALLSENIISYLSLVGSNGVDFILNDDLYIIEVNPRIQGTLECIEASLGVNMVKAHMEACEGIMMDNIKPRKFAVKMIIHAKERSLFRNLNLRNLYDIPGENVIIEKGEPIATVVTSERILENALYSANRQVNNFYNSLITI